MSTNLYDAYLKLAKEAMSFKSISTDLAFAAEMTKTAEWFQDAFVKHGFECELVEGYGNPIILARYNVSSQSPTVLIYGHYDVQPASKDDGWSTDPFTLTEKDGRLLGRGAIDNKGQVLIHVAAIFDLIQAGRLTSNIVFMIEGNEETGSPLLESFVKEHADKLTSDYIMISDGEVVEDYPVIEAGFRGVINATVTLQTLKTDLHSGLMGGVAPSSAHEAARLISTFHNPDNRVLIEGFYDDVVEPTPAQLDNNEAIPFSIENYEKITGSKWLFNESKTNIYTQTGLRPSLEVTGIAAGYSGVGYRNSVPGSSVVKINIRIVEGQDPEKIQKAFKNHVLHWKPEYVKCGIEFSESSPAVSVDISDPVFRTTEKILADVSGKRVLYKYVGGSIPIVGTFKDILNVPILLVPLANEDCNMHGADENFQVSFAKRSLEFSKRFFSRSGL